MEDKVKLFLKYMEKEKELRLQWDEEDGYDVHSPEYKLNLLCVDRVKSFIAYRNIRIEEAWYSKLNKGKRTKEVINKLYDYDEERVKRHAKALKAISDINKFGEDNGLEKFYDGEVLDVKDIDSYRNIPIRKKETDFFLSFIDTLGRTPGIKITEYFKEIGIKGEAKEEFDFIRELQAGVEKIDREHNIEEPILKDDENIKFGDDKLLDKFTR